MFSLHSCLAHCFPVFAAPSVHLLGHIAIVPVALVAVDLFVFPIPFAAARAAETISVETE